MSPPERERGGGPAVEAVIVVAAIGLVLTFGIATVRLSLAEATTDHAARAAARLASIQRDPAAASAGAEDAARDVFAGDGIACAALDVTLAEVDGQYVESTVRCDVHWSDLVLPGAPGTYGTEATAISVIDRYREAP